MRLENILGADTFLQAYRVSKELVKQSNLFYVNTK